MLENKRIVEKDPALKSDDLIEGLAITYRWIDQQYQMRKAGQRVGAG
jgi:hypothetical protein